MSGKSPSERVWDASNSIISNIGNPVNNQDAVNKQTLVTELDKKVPYLDEALDAYIFEKRVGGILNPMYSDEAVNVGYLVANTVHKENSNWQCSNLSLVNVGDPKSMADAVNVKYLKENVPHLIDGGGINFGRQSAKNLGDPDELMSAVNVNYLVRVLSNVLFDICHLVIPPMIIGPGQTYTQQERENWMRANIVDRYFLNTKERSIVGRAPGYNFKFD